MLGSRRKTLLFMSGVLQRTPPSAKLWLFIQCNPPTFSAKYSANPLNLESFTTSYLVHSCGFSPDIALLLSKRVNFKTEEKPDSVLTFLRNYGFSDSQVRRVVQCCPNILLAEPGKLFLPKFEFFQSQGVSSSELVEMLTASPYVLNRSLKNHIIPYFDFLKDFLQSDERAISIIKRRTTIISQRHCRANILGLLDIGVPKVYIRRLLTGRPLLFQMNCRTFSEGVDKVKELGFNPSHSCFVVAFNAVNGMGKDKWNQKIEIFKKWGWTEDAVLAAFRSYPPVMMISTGKLMAVMDFLVNQMGWDTSALARRPVVLNLSLEKRLIPRTSVLAFLSSKGLIKKLTISNALLIPEDLFLERYVQCFKQDAQHLMKLYKEKLNVRNNK